MGRLTRDPEIRYSQSDSKPIGRFSLAVDRRFKRDGQPDADFFNFVTFGRQAEFVEKYLTKGTKVIVEARPQNNNYTAQDGTKVYSVDFVVDSIEFAESKSASENRGNGGSNSQQTAPKQDKSTGSGFMEAPDYGDGDLPF
jgi:single-strand DNA-binding protein